MTKKEFVKLVENLRKYDHIDLSTLTLNITIWHGQTMGEDNAIYIDTCLMDNNYNTLISDIDYGKYTDLEDNEENLKLLNKEQKQIKTKMVKWLEWFEEIEIVTDEQNV